MRIFTLLFLLYPVLELAVMIKVGSQIGVLATLLLLAAAGVLGMLVIRLGGLATALSARQQMAQGGMPDKTMFNGLFVVLAGGLLLLPGFISDFFAVLLLLPPVRNLIVQSAKRKAQAQSERQRAFAEEMAAARGQSSAQRPSANVIEGEYQRHDQ